MDKYIMHKGKRRLPFTPQKYITPSIYMERENINEVVLISNIEGRFSFSAFIVRNNDRFEYEGEVIRSQKHV